MANLKRPLHGPSLYYATDKNIFDALNEHKVNSATVAGLFKSRNTLISPQLSRQKAAKYFSLLTHDYFDHQTIAAKLGVVARRERIATVDVVTEVTAEALWEVANDLARSLREDGDVVDVKREPGRLLFLVQYSQVDYRRSEFNQVQVKDGVIEFHVTSDGFVLRNTQNDYVDGIRDTLLQRIGEVAKSGLSTNQVTLFAFPDPGIRSEFFFDLFSGLDGYHLIDVTDVFVYKPAVSQGGHNPDDDDELDDESLDSHVERVALRGRGVSRSDYLGRLTSDGYYTVRVAWKVKEKYSLGNAYDLEAVFADPLNCTKFSYLVVGVYDYTNEGLSTQRRTPNRGEVAELSKAIEARARKLMVALTAQLVLENESDGATPG